MSPHALLDIRDLRKRFTLHERNTTFDAAHAEHITVWPGRLTALLGPSGVGKSSLLKCIYRSYVPSSGVLRYQRADGALIDLATAPEADIVALRRTEISFVTQFFHCLPRQSALEVVARPLYACGIDHEIARAAARALLATLGLPERLWSLPPATFSGGEKQRVNLARELVRRPRLLLLDEPSASLDPAAVERVVTLLEALKGVGVGMLAIFHDPDLVQRLADEIVPLNTSEET
jgi:alpha-D-ribose 1-methylphosphonate 5-triphosphate synthase subunit PhnL